MGNIKQVILYVIFLILGLFAVIMIGMSAPKQGVRYDCMIAEISPDYPLEVKQACRKHTIDK